MHTWLCRADRGARGSMHVHTWLGGADRGTRGSIQGHAQRERSHGMRGADKSTGFISVFSGDGLRR